MEFEIVFFTSPQRRHRPAQEALDDMKAKSADLHKNVVAKISLLKNREYHKLPVSAHFEGKIHYVRGKAGHNWGRVFYTFNNRQIVLLDGYNKTSDKIPDNIKERVRIIYAEFCKVNNKGGSK